MNNIILAALCCLFPAALCAQQVKLLEAEDSTENSPETVTLLPAGDETTPTATQVSTAPASPVAPSAPVKAPSAPEVKTGSAAVKSADFKLVKSTVAPAVFTTARKIPATPAVKVSTAAKSMEVKAVAPAKAAAAPLKTSPPSVKAPAAVPGKAAPAAVKPTSVSTAPVKAIVSGTGAAKPAARKPAAAAKIKVAAVIIPEKETAPGAGFVAGKKHGVLRGETLWGLSGKYYSDPYKWGKIYNANLATVVNPDRIYPGEELNIPDIVEEIRPEIYKPVEAADSADAAIVVPVSDGDFAPRAAGSAARAVPAASGAQPAVAQHPQTAYVLLAADKNALSEEMPENQKEWAEDIRIVPDFWHEDGMVISKEKGSMDNMDDSLSLTGEMIYILLSGPGIKPGDDVSIYMKGSDSYDSAGKRIGREMQYVGIASVVSVEGRTARARVMDAKTAIYKGFLVKKK